jgi:hypothetical protein
MIGIPQLRGDEYIFAGDCASCELCLQCLTHLPLIAISFCTIKVTKSNSQSVGGCAPGFGWIRDQSSETESRDGARPKVKGYFRQAKIRMRIGCHRNIVVQIIYIFA